MKTTTKDNENNKPFQKFIAHHTVCLGEANSKKADTRPKDINLLGGKVVARLQQTSIYIKLDASFARTKAHSKSKKEKQTQNETKL